MPLATGTAIGAFVITSPLGAGSMGEVYRARDTRLGREVALKILPESFASDPDRLMRFEREAKTLASLNHPHIAQIYGLEQVGNESALVMELVEGEDLAQRLSRGAMPLDEALPIARQIAEALEAAHDAGIIHRDLKPANIKVRPDGTVKVLDFGLAKSGLSAVAPSGAKADAQDATAAYMAPEQAKGKPLDRRADIWAFGCVLYEMLTGRRVFDGDDVTDTIAAVITREPDWSRLPAATPPSAERLLRRCIEKQLTRRLPHIGIARLDLEESDASDAQLRSSAPARHAGRYRAQGLAAGAMAGTLAIYLALGGINPAPAPNPPMQLTLPTPGANYAVSGVSLSPDGRYLVTRGGGNEGVTLHALDGSATRTLEADGLCWSPDGRTLVQHRGNELLKSTVAGGVSTVFAAAPPGPLDRCSWSLDGTVLFTIDGRLYHTGPAGGSLVPVDVEDGEGIFRFGPQFLSDGRRFLYWAITASQQIVRAGSLDSRDTTAIVESDAPPVYRAGHLLFHRGATLLAQTFDEPTLTLRDRPRAITSEAAPGSLADMAMFDTSNNGTLVFRITNGGVKGRHVWMDRVGNVLGTLPQPAGSELLNLVISPEGTHVAGNRRDPSSGNWDIWTVDLRSGIATRLTSDSATDSDPAWSPDGTEIAYVSHRTGAAGIYRVSLASGREDLVRRINVPPFRSAALRTTDWTPDGRFIVFQLDGDILAVPSNRPGEVIPIAATAVHESSGRVSPDGRWIAFQSADYGVADVAVYVQPFPGPGPRTRLTASAGWGPQWRGDGREVFWVRSGSGVFSTALSFSVERVEAAAEKRALPPGIDVLGMMDGRSHMAVTQDGTRFLLRQNDGQPGPELKLIVNWPELLRTQ